MENQDTPENTAAGSVGTSDLFGSLGWLVETFRTEISPFSASTDLNHPQSSQWRCHGCEGVFTSHWPTWTEPTDETFPHEQHCKYMKAVRLTQAKPNTGSQTQPPTTNQL